MKQNAYTKLIVAMIAISCLCCSCTKGPANEPGLESEPIESSSIEDEDDLSKITSDESSSDTETWISDSSEDSDVVSPSDDVLTLTDPQTPSSDTAKLGAANVSNGGFATGDGKFVYYATRPSADRAAVIQEDRATGMTSQVYLSVPKEGPAIDYLCVSGDYLFFRENIDDRESFDLVKVNLTDGNAEVIASGEIASMSIYKDRLYFADHCNLVATDFNGENKEVLYQADHDATPAELAYCFANGKIYFASPADYDKDGYFFGQLYSMDLDGQNQTKIKVNAGVCNSGVFMSDGDSLYFFGESEAEGMGLYTCRLDGSELTALDKDTPRSMNFVSGNYFMATDQELYMKKDASGYQLIDNADYRWANICIVGDDLYYISQDAKDPDALPVMNRLPIYGGSAEKLG